jgi:hypothetical protein
MPTQFLLKFTIVESHIHPLPFPPEQDFGPRLTTNDFNGWRPGGRTISMMAPAYYVHLIFLALLSRVHVYLSLRTYTYTWRARERTGVYRTRSKLSEREPQACLAASLCRSSSLLNPPPPFYIYEWVSVCALHGCIYTGSGTGGGSNFSSDTS